MAENVLSWGDLRQLKKGTGVGVLTCSGERFAGKLVVVSPTDLVVTRVDRQMSTTVYRTEFGRAVLLDWKSEMRDWEDLG